MNVENARRLLAEIPADALVVDVGGGAAPFPRADYVLDALPYDRRGSGSDGHIHRQLADHPPRYSKETWCQLDLCDHTPWPFPDKMFDFAICAHVLEDVRDPIWICQELCRVARAGYIEVPSRLLEQCLGVENPRYAGYYHHRWLITRNANGLEFRHKPHLLHSTTAAIVARVGVRSVVNPTHSFLALQWAGAFAYSEVTEFDEGEVVRELCAFAQQARSLPGLTVPSGRPWWRQLKLLLYYRRLSHGLR
jgi:hypothetical protein